MKRALNLSIVALLCFSCAQPVPSDDRHVTDANTPLHLLKPDYPVKYGETTLDSIKADLDKIYAYLEEVTPAALIDDKHGKGIEEIEQIDTNTIFQKGDFRLISYEWGVTYGAMLRASEVTKDKKYEQYTQTRLQFISDVLPKFQALEKADSEYHSPVHSVLNPGALDDAGSMCAAFIKAKQLGVLTGGIDGILDNYIDYILHKE